MDEDIVTRLRGFVFKNGRLCSCDPCLARDEAADEIERLRKTAYALIDELRHNGGYEAYTPKMLFEEFYEQAVNDG